MKNKTSKKSQIKLIVIALALLLCFALAVGITTAFYKANRQAIGYVNMDKGLLFEVENMKSADNDTLLYYEGKDVTVAPVELTTTGKPNEYYYIANPTITPLEGTVPYAVRGYLEYVFYDNTGAERTVDELGGDLNTILNKLFVLDSLNSPISFGDGWLLDSKTGYYYNVNSMTAGQVVTNIKEHSYEVGGTSTGTTKVFAEQTVNGEPIALLTLNDWKAEFGGPIVNNIEIGKFTVKLNLEVLQYNEMALISRWEMSKTETNDQGDIVGVQGDNVTLEPDAEVGNGSEPIIFEGTDLEAILPDNGGNVSLNGNSFSDKVDLEEITITGNPVSKTTVYIGSKAFYGCTQLKMNLTEHENIEYVIASDAFSAGATIMHGASDITSLIVNPSTSGQTSGVDNKWQVATNVYLFLPNSTPTPNPGTSSSGSSTTSYGSYVYTDAQGTWYFDLLDASGNKVTLSQVQSGGVSTLGASTFATSTDYVARINKVDNLSTVENYTIPAQVGTSKLDGTLFSVTAVGGEGYSKSSVFLNAEIVTTIILPNVVTKIGYGAFQGCARLRNIDIPDSVTRIGNSAFEKCSDLTGITIPYGVTFIGDLAFSECSSLTGITIPDSVTRINYSVFKKCSGLTAITIPDGVDYIYGEAFSGCTSLTNITIPDSVTFISSDAFSGCTGLDEFIVSGNGTYTTFDNGNLLMQGTEIVAFAQYGISEYEIPNNVTSIGDDAFRGRTGLTSIIIPDSVISIGFRAFVECKALTSITIPDSVTSIEGAAFQSCYRLTSATIGEGVEAIPEGCFGYCIRLETVTVGSGVTSIGSNAFQNCTNLTTFNWVIEYELGGVSADITNGVIVSDSVNLGTLGVIGDAPTNIENGITFEGWSDGATTYQPGNEYTFTLTNRKLTAVWSIATVSFHANGGEGVIEKLTADKTVGVTIPDGSALTKENYVFLGWATDPTATTAEYTPGNIVYESMILYAVWAKYIVVNFDANGGEGTIPESIVGDSHNGVKFTIPNCELTKDGGIFVGWASYASATTPTYTAGSSASFYSDTVLYAVWEKIISVTFDMNGGNGENVSFNWKGSKKYDIGNYVPQPSRDGSWVFLGWSLDPNATSAGFTQSSTINPNNLNKGNDVTLYAVWQAA